MKYLTWPILFLFIEFSIGISAQGITNDTILKKDTTIRQKLRTIVQSIIKDTVPKRETEKDTLLEKTLGSKVYSFSHFEHETFLFAKAPTKWNKTDWFRLGLVLTVTAAIMPFDERFCYITQSHQSYYYTVPVLIGNIYGAWYFTTAVTAISLGYTLVTHNIEAKKIDIELIQAGIYSELITELFKVGIGRAGPNEYLGAFEYHPFGKLQNNFESMPSGSASFAFALSTITFRHAHSRLMKILAYVPAAFSLFSNVYKNQHWASDEFLGAAIGYGTGEWVVNLHEGKRHKINLSANN